MVATWQSVITTHIASDSYQRGGIPYDDDDGDKHTSRRTNEPSFWFRVLRYTIHGFLGAYLAVAAWESRSYRVDHGSSPAAGAPTPQSTTGVVYTSPEGLSMTLHNEFPEWVLQVHRWAGVALIPLVGLQMYLVPKMRYRVAAAAAARDPRRPVAPATTTDFAGSRERARKAHVVVGYLALGAIGYMTGCGFMLRDSSTFSGFSVAMIFFAAPWVIFLALLPYSVWKGYRLLHAAVGGLVFKACVAVPLARTLGVTLQYMWRTDSAAMSWGYYTGIVSAAVAVGAWAIRDLFCLVREMSAESKRRQQ